MEKKFENVAYSYLFNFDTKKTIRVDRDSDKQ